MAPKSVVGICFFITAPPINHQHIFLLCCTSGCKDHFVVLVALVNPTSSFNRSYWSIVLETDSSLKIHLHCCCWVWAKTTFIIWVQKCLQSSKYQAKIDANEYQNKGNASYISNLNWISSQRLRIALYFIRETILPSNCLIVQCYISQWIEKKCRLCVHYS